MIPGSPIPRLGRTLDDAGLRGSFLVRDLNTGEEIGIDPEKEYPIASLVKVPLAIAVLERIRRGELTASSQLEVRPGNVSLPGPTGVTRFRHPARIAIADLVYLSVSLSDGGATDRLFDLIPPTEVMILLRELGITGINVRHRMLELVETPAARLDPDEAHLAHLLAARAGTASGGHQLPQLDISRANTGTARALVDLLHALWLPSKIADDVQRQMQQLLAANVHRQRLTPSFESDSARWSAKTGTLLNLRHEIGVVEYDNGDLFAVAALTESRVPAVVQHQAEEVIGQVARSLHDALRGGSH